jgi:hypothetical protein
VYLCLLRVYDRRGCAAWALADKIKNRKSKDVLSYNPDVTHTSAKIKIRRNR